MGWASDRWTAGPVTLTLLTPFGPVPDVTALADGELRRHLCPAILAEITIDNRAFTEEAVAFFGIGSGAPLRPLSDTSVSLRGIARGGDWGLAIRPDGAVEEALSDSLEQAILDTMRSRLPAPIHRLAKRGALLFRAAPGRIRTWTVALGCYRDGVVTTGIAGTYLYARLFADLDAVLAYALANAEHYRTLARARDAELDAAPVSPERRFLIAHATHSYQAATMLLHDDRNVVPRAPFAPTAPLHRPLWVVNVDETRMMNPLDQTVDMAFWEKRFHPWTLRNTLDLYVGRYCYVDDVQDTTTPERRRRPGGIAFNHDMGAADQFTPPGTSAYELPDRDPEFAPMPHEELCNWCLSAALYALPTVRMRSLPGATPEGRAGDLLWLAGRRPTLRACLESLVHRDGTDGRRDGIMTFDSVRCGAGHEGTTYAGVDTSLSHARGSLYLAVKTWATYLALGRCFDALGEERLAAEAEEQAARAAATIARQWDPATETFPAVFDASRPNAGAHILPAVEGLAFPLLLGDNDAVSFYGPYGELLTYLRRHLKSCMVSGLCVDSTTGGLRLTSASADTWMSKVFLCQFVAESILGVAADGSFDAIHAGWQRNAADRGGAFTDRIDASDGASIGSRFSPRGVTAILWLADATE
jgi:hypothetical protein